MNKCGILVLMLTCFFSVLNLKAEDSGDVSIPKDSVKMSFVGSEVIIEAFKANSNLSQLPISATLLSPQEIKERNVTNIKDINAFVPNLFIPDYGSKMTSPAYIRGVGSRINAPSVGLYVDGIPYFDRSTFDIDMTDVERVEVLRGPQGTIYGRNTMGGIINVYTKSPYKYNETNVHVGMGNYDRYELSGSHYGKISNTLGYSFAGSLLHQGGYFTNQYTGKKADPMDAANARVKLSWKVLPQLYMHLTSAYEYSDQGGYPYGVYNSDDNTVAPVNYNEPSSYRRNMSTNGLNLEYTADCFKMTSMSSFQFYDGRQLIDQDFTNKDLYFVNFYQLQRMFSQEINVKSTTSGNFQWQFGTFAFHQSYDTDYKIEYRTLDSLTLQNAANPSQGFALYHQSTYNNLFVRGLSATLGIRFDWEESRVHTLVNSQGASNRINSEVNIEDRRHFTQWTPKAALQYSFDKNQLVYISATKGFKSGGFNATAENEADRFFRAENSWSYELGTKLHFFDNLLQAEASLFRINWNDQQVSQTQPSDRGFLIRNAGKSVSKGFELATQVNPMQHLNFQLTYGYTYATFKEYMYINTTERKVDYTGNYLAMVPRHTFSTAANYTLLLKNRLIQKVVFNAQYTGLGKLYWNENNQVSQPYYGTVNARTSLVKNNISVDLWAKNITNTHYIAYQFASMGQQFAQAGRPFTCGVDLRFKF